jgi:hypothetical protein
MGALRTARDDMHRRLITERPLALRNGVPTIADADSKMSSAIAREVVATLSQRLNVGLSAEVLSDQSQGSVFALIVKQFVEAVLARIKVGGWLCVSGGSIDRYAQYAHLGEVQRLINTYPELRLTLGGDYIIAPDVVVYREPLEDDQFGEGVLDTGDQDLAKSTFIRRRNTPALPVMHASVSCKWTLRSDRAQNARTEALNLLRLRKGRAPAIVVVTGEPLPSRLASLADGTGDVDRVYHFALYEIQDAVEKVVEANPTVAGQKQKSDLARMVDGRRLADISDLPFDLAT